MNNLFATTSSDPVQAAFAGGIIGSIFVETMLIFLVFYVLLIIAHWIIFTKAGEKGWKSLIPIYNTYIMFKIVNMKSWFWYLICIAICASIMMVVDGFNPNGMTPEELASFNYIAHPMTLIALVGLAIVELTAAIIYSYRTSKVFGHGIGYAVGLFFLPNIFWLILAFGSSKYDKKNLKK